MRLLTTHKALEIIEHVGCCSRCTKFQKLGKVYTSSDVDFTVKVRSGTLEMDETMANAR